MRTFILITALVLASATAHAGDRSLTKLASGDDPAAAAPAQPADTTATAGSPQFVERPSVAAEPAAQCQPAATTSTETPKQAPKQVGMSERPKRRHASTQARVVSELHRYGIYW